MALNPLLDSRDQRFVLFEVLDADKFNQFEKYADFDRDTYEATLELAEQIAVEQVYPSNKEADKSAPSMIQRPKPSRRPKVSTPP